MRICLPVLASLMMALGRDLSWVTPSRFEGVGSTEYFNLLLNSNSVDNGLVYGNIGLRLYPGDNVKAFADTYNFDQKSWLNPLNWGRNIETLIGGAVAGKGTPYQLNFYGIRPTKCILIR